MKVILQDYEPQQMPVVAVLKRAVTVPARRVRVRLTPVVSDARLFHAL